MPAPKQTMRHLEDDLYFVMDERGRSVHLTEKGVETMSPQDPTLFVVPDISHAVHEIEHDERLSPKEKIERRREVEGEYAQKTEFFDIYKLEVVVIPTNRPVRRVDKHDLVYKTRREKYNAIIEEVERQHKRGLPVLVGTVTVDVSETLARMLKRSGLKHEVLNAK